MRDKIELTDRMRRRSLAVFNFFSPIKDFFAVVLTSFLAGAGGYLFAFFGMERR